MSTRNNNAQLEIAVVVKIIGIVLFIVVGIAVVEPMMSVGERLSAEKCKTLLEAKMGAAKAAAERSAAFLDALPTAGKKAMFVGPASTIMDTVPDFDVDILGMDVVSKEGGTGQLDSVVADKEEQITQEAMHAVFNSLPQVCGTMRANCKGSVREVSECLHERAAWTFHALTGGEYMPYEMNLDLYEVEVQVTEPSTLVMYAGSGRSALLQREACSRISSALDEEYGKIGAIGAVSVAENMPFGTWCSLEANMVTPTTIALSSLMNCYEQKDGPLSSQCKCFYHADAENTLRQGLKVFDPFEGIEEKYKFPQYPGYTGCGMEQPDYVPEAFDLAFLVWTPAASADCFTGLPGYEDEICTVDIGVHVTGENTIEVVMGDEKVSVDSERGWEGAAAGGAAGATGGAMIGSVIAPGIGTVVGGGLGAIGGAVGGYFGITEKKIGVSVQGITFAGSEARGFTRVYIS